MSQIITQKKRWVLNSDEILNFFSYNTALESGACGRPCLTLEWEDPQEAEEVLGAYKESTSRFSNWNGGK